MCLCVREVCWGVHVHSRSLRCVVVSFSMASLGDLVLTIPASLRDPVSPPTVAETAFGMGAGKGSNIVLRIA